MKHLANYIQQLIADPKRRSKLRVLNWVAPLMILCVPVLCWMFVKQPVIFWHEERRYEYYDRFLRGEHGPIELLTNVFLLLAVFIGSFLIYKLYKSKQPSGITLFFFLFTFGVFFTLTEEISWGQHFTRSAPPDAIRPFTEAVKSVNYQGEFNVHNMPGINEYAHLLSLFFGIGGLVGIYLRRFRPIKTIAPPVFLFHWFLLISLFGLGEAIEKIYPRFSVFYPWYFGSSAEYVELLIGICCFLYLSHAYLSFYKGKNQIIVV